MGALRSDLCRSFPPSPRRSVPMGAAVEYLPLVQSMADAASFITAILLNLLGGVAPWTVPDSFTAPSTVDAWRRGGGRLFRSSISRGP